LWFAENQSSEFESSCAIKSGHLNQDLFLQPLTDNPPPPSPVATINPKHQECLDMEEKDGSLASLSGQ
jgi:hypothetical protein